MAPLPAGVYNLMVTDTPHAALSEGQGLSPLPAVFLSRGITLDDKEAANPIEIRAIPHVVVTGQFHDSSGKPIKDYVPASFVADQKPNESAEVFHRNAS